MSQVSAFFGKRELSSERCSAKEQLQMFDLRKLGNTRKMSNLDGEKILGNSSQKVRKIRYHRLLVLSSFTGCPYFVPNILSGSWLKPPELKRNPSLLLFLILSLSFFFFVFFLFFSTRRQKNNAVLVNVKLDNCLCVFAFKSLITVVFTINISVYGNILFVKIIAETKFE